MRMLRLASALVVAAASISAQSPLTTTFANNNAGGVGGGVYFNLTVAIPVTVTALDCHLNDVANTAGTIDFFILPNGTHVGAENNIALWTLLGSGPITAAGVGLPSPVTLSAVLPAGTHGICIRHNGVSAAYTNGTGANQTYVRTEMTLNAGSALNTAFGPGTPFSPRVWNGSIYYSTASGTVATVTRTGVGCINSAASYYEVFNPGVFDMSNSAFQMIPSGPGYQMLPSAATLVAPVAAHLGLSDDSLSAPLAMPFTLNYPGGSTNSIVVCSNGYIYFGAGLVADYTPTVTELLSGSVRLCPFWNDHLPNATNNIHYDVDNVNNRVLVTWNAVPEFGGAGSCTMQVVIYSTGIIEMVYQGVTHPGHPGTPIVGFSPGAGNRDPGNRDISTTMPFATGADSNPLTQDSGRPVIGTNINLTVGNIPGGSLAGLELIGLNSGGIDLAGAGAPGCTLWVLPILATIPFGVGGATASIPVGIPNDPALIGGALPVQAVAINLGINPLGVVTSNLATLNFGNL